MVEAFIDTQDAYDSKRTFQRRCPSRNPPSVRTIRCNDHKCLIDGTSKNRNKNNARRHHNASTLQNIAAILRDIQRNQSVSSRKYNAPVSKTTFNKITRNDLNFHPHQVHT